MCVCMCVGRGRGEEEEEEKGGGLKPAPPKQSGNKMCSAKCLSEAAAAPLPAPAPLCSASPPLPPSPLSSSPPPPPPLPGNINAASSLPYAALDPTWKTQIPVSNTWETFGPARQGACAPSQRCVHTHTHSHTHRTHSIPSPARNLRISIVPPPLLTFGEGGKAAGMRAKPGGGRLRAGVGVGRRKPRGRRRLR